MKGVARVARIFVAFVVPLVVLATSAWIWNGVVATDFGVCVRGIGGDYFEKALASLDSNVELGIKLSVAIVGVGGALLLGLKSGVDMPRWTKAIFVSALFCFVESALFGAWWRLGVADGWLNECPNLVREPRLTAIYRAAFISFILGLLVLMVLLVAIVAGGAGKIVGGGEAKGANLD